MVEFKVGDEIKFLPPFSAIYPNSYKVLEVNREQHALLVDLSFDFDGPEKTAVDFSYVEAL